MTQVIRLVTLLSDSGTAEASPGARPTGEDHIVAGLAHSEPQAGAALGLQRDETAQSGDDLGAQGLAFPLTAIDEIGGCWLS